MTWELLESSDPEVRDPMVIHTYPLNDLHEHDRMNGDSCLCSPTKVTYENGNVQIIHNSWDGREQWEEAEIA